MQSLSQRISVSSPLPEPVDEEPEKQQKDPDLVRLEVLMEAGDASEAFFLARRLVANGEAWAEAWVDKAKAAFEASS
jgi:hypothetical protein